MARLRTHLRFFVIACLVLQVSLVTSVIAQGCCPDHQAAAEQCHEHDPAASAHHGMHGSDATASHEMDIDSCPMHHPGAPSEQATECSIEGICPGPLPVLMALLSPNAVASEPSAVVPEWGPGDAATPAPQNTVSRLVPPDAPPPRP